MTTIEWTHRPGTKGAVWNPSRGCRVLSPGCEHCYAMRQAHRFSGKDGAYEGLTQLRNKGPVWTGDGRLVADTLDLPLRWRTPRTVFVNSMSDLFFEKFTNEEIAAVFGVMAACPQHIFQVLTKRAERMREWFEWFGMHVRDGSALAGYAADRIEGGREPGGSLAPWLYEHTKKIGWAWPLPNVWLGVSVENQKYADERIPELLRTRAAVRFVSYEPALGPVDFSRWVFDREAAIREAVRGPAHLNRDQADDAIGYPLHWIICGGESGPGARTFDLAWARRVVEQCKTAGVACFVKQFGKVAIDSDQPVPPCEELPMRPLPLVLKDRKGGNWNEWPKALRVRQWPEVRP